MFSFPSRARAGYIFGIALLAGLPAAAARPTETSYSILHSFQAAERGPQGSLTSDGQGNLYGTTAYGGASDRGTVFMIKRDGTGFQRLHNFSGDPNDGSYPYASLTLDGFGNLYGTTSGGGPSNAGTVFKLRTDGTGFQLLHSFAGGSSGRVPYVSLILDGHGNLYGTTTLGGQPAGYDAFGGRIEGGTIFKLKTDGTGFQVLHAFAGGVSEGFEPEASLILDDSGNLYGTTASGGSSACGSVYTIKEDGTGIRRLHDFADDAKDGCRPFASLTLDAFGNLYGTTVLGGTSGVGTVFQLRKDGTAFQLLHSFAGGVSDGSYPYASLLLDKSGDLYGTTKVADDRGNNVLFPAVIFRIRTDATGYQIMHNFVDAKDGRIPSGFLILVSSETLYGTMEQGGSSNAGTVFSIHTDGSFFQVLYSFEGFLSDGGNPWASVVSDGCGYLYGTTIYGGSSSAGTVYRIRSDGSGFQLLRAFRGGKDDGASPSAPLIVDRAGNLYGTTTGGGSSGGGTVFRLKTDGTGFQLLHSFVGGAGDGLDPLSGLLLDGEDNLYGTTIGGGANASGTVFSLKTNGTGFQLLHTFTYSPNDGVAPWGSLIVDGFGNLYGTTNSGGAPSDAGTVFTLRKDGSDFRILHTFTDRLDDGGYPPGALIMDTSGNLYGTAISGGPAFGGTVFKLKTDGTGFQLLHTFAANATEGWNPYASLTLDGSGRLYGTTRYGGSTGFAGTVFTLRTDGSDFRVLHSFGEDANDGRNPSASLLLDGSETLVGTTQSGGAGTFGTVFALSISRPRVALPGPFVPAQKR